MPGTVGENGEEGDKGAKVKIVFLHSFLNKIDRIVVYGDKCTMLVFCWDVKLHSCCLMSHLEAALPPHKYFKILHVNILIVRLNSIGYLDNYFIMLKIRCLHHAQARKVNHEQKKQERNFCRDSNTYLERLWFWAIRSMFNPKLFSS